MEGISNVNYTSIPARDSAVLDASVKTAEGTAQANAASPQPAVTAEAAIPQKPATSAEILAETLLSHGYKVTEENKNMLRLMLDNGIPLTKENIARMNQALKLAQSSDKALFMLQNNMRMTQANAAQLEGLVSGQTKITDQIKNLMSAVEQLADKELAAQLKQILSGTGKATAQAETNQNNAPAEGLAEGAKQTAQTPAQMPQTSQAPQASQAATPASAETVAPQQATPAPTAGNAATMAMGTQSASQQQQTAQQAESAALATQQNAQGTQQSNTQQATPTQVPQSTEARQTAQSSAQPATAQGGQTASPPSATTEATTQAQQTQQAQVLSQAAQQRVSQPTTQSQALPQASAQTAQPSPAIPQNLLFQLEDSTPQTLDRYLNNLRETLTQVQQALAGRESADTTRVLQEARALESHIDFTAQIRNQLFVQIPLFHNGQQTLTNLHVYKDGKKSSGGGTSASSALIALDTAAMGHFETYVQKTSNAVHCQFRLESDEIAKSVRNNIHKLESLLRENGYSLDSFSFLPPGEPYTLLDTPKSIENSPQKNTNELPHFDIHI
ncbi:MAG: hypothetical protein FWC89_07890 [Defluviitaleaceae bacterium]|nr:hypothetical protein [Defluviitaleaceae bacterium]